MRQAVANHKADGPLVGRLQPGTISDEAVRGWCGVLYVQTGEGVVTPCHVSELCRGLVRSEREAVLAAVATARPSHLPHGAPSGRSLRASSSGNLPILSRALASNSLPSINGLRMPTAPGMSSKARRVISSLSAHTRTWR